MNDAVRNRRLSSGLAAVFLVALVGGAAMAGGEPFRSGDQPSEGQQVRVEPPRPVGRGRTADGNDVSIQYSRATLAQVPGRPSTCVQIKVDGPEGPPRGVGRPGASEVCGPPPGDGRLTFAVDTVLYQASTGTFTDDPVHFISGYTTEHASNVVLEDAAGRSTKLELAAAEDGQTKVFWGAVPSGFRLSDMSLEARRPGGAPLAKEDLSVGGPPPPGVPPLE